MRIKRLQVYLLNIIFWATLFETAPIWYRWLAPILILILLIPELLSLIESKKKATSVVDLKAVPTWFSVLISLAMALLLLGFLTQTPNLALIFQIILVACAAIIIFLEVVEWRARRTLTRQS